jgi:TetR/AcrR family transcriptional regulator, cholesterol catabolism regulator
VADRRRVLAPAPEAPRGGAKGPSRPGSRARYEKRRQEVIDTAARLFAQRGYHATSVDDLVEATGLQRGGLYHYIDGKSELLIVIHERFIEPLLREAREIAARDDPPDVQLRALAEALLRDIAAYRNEVTVFLHEWRALRSTPAWEGVRAARKEFEDIIAQVLERGRDEGVFQFADTRVTLLAFLGMINWSYQWYDPRGPAQPEEIAGQFADILLSGISS